MQRTTPFTCERAKTLRSRMTDAESQLWNALRAHRLNGLKFYRQVPIGPYIADFASHRHRLIIEVDGATHGSAEEERHDMRRDRYLRQAGYRTLRFSNSEVFGNLSGVLDSILLSIKEV